MKKKFIVTIDMPIGATVSDVKNYIRDAVGTWGGCYHPDDPLFGSRNVTVTTYKEPKK